MGSILDQVGRLLASSRLLDLAINNEASVQRTIEAFFQGDYDFLQQAQEARIPGFYTNTGNWKVVAAEGRKLLQQDGSEYGSILTAGLTNFMGKVIGHKYLELLDNIEAYFYFPLAIAKESFVTNGRFQVDMQFEGTVPKGIRRGQTLQIRLALSDEKQAIRLPRGGFFQQTGGNWIFKVSADGKTAYKADILLGNQNPDFYEVLQGLKPGDKVITSSYENYGTMQELVLKK